MPETRRYDELEKAAVLNDTDEVAVAQAGAEELKTTQIGALTEKVSANIAQGALVELGATVSAGKKLIAAALRVKGTDSRDADSFVELANDIETLDAAGSKDTVRTRVAVAARSNNGVYYQMARCRVLHDKGAMLYFYNKILYLKKLGQAEDFASAPAASYDLTQYTRSEANWSMSLNADCTKCALTVENNLVLVFDVDVEAGTLTLNSEVAVEGLSLPTSYTDYMGALSEDGTLLVMGYDYSNYIVINLRTKAYKVNSSDNFFGNNLSQNTVPVIQGGLFYSASGSTVREWKVNADTLDMTYLSLYNLPAANNNTFYIPGLHGYVSVWYQNSKDAQDFGFYLFLLGTKTSKTAVIKAFFVKGKKVDRRSLGIYAKKINQHVWRFYSFIGFLDYDENTGQFTGEQFPGGEFKGNAYAITGGADEYSGMLSSNLAASDDESKLYMVHISANYIHTADVYPDKIQAFFLQRNGRVNYALISDWELSELEAGGYDSLNKILPVEEGAV